MSFSNLVTRSLQVDEFDKPHLITQQMNETNRQVLRKQNLFLQNMNADADVLYVTELYVIHNRKKCADQSHII